MTWSSTSSYILIWFSILLFYIGFWKDKPLPINWTSLFDLIPKLASCSGLLPNPTLEFKPVDWNWESL